MCLDVYTSVTACYVYTTLQCSNHDEYASTLLSQGVRDGFGSLVDRRHVSLPFPPFEE